MRLMTILVIICVPAYGQKKYAETITSTELKEHLYIVAGKEMEGRAAASRGEKRAAEYLSDQFKKAGLLPGNEGSYLMPVPIYREMYSSAMEIDGVPLVNEIDFTANGANYESTMFFSEVVYAGSYQSESIERYSLRDKLVIVDNFEVSSFAYRHGAAAILVLQDEGRPLHQNKEWLVYDLPFEAYQGPPGYNISKAAANRIMNGEYEQMSKASRTDNFTPVNYKSRIMLQFRVKREVIYCNNVIGYVEGTDKKDEYVVMSAHYDHKGMLNDSTIYYGADDDGSGTVSLIELAEAFVKAKADGKGPKRSVVFIAFTGEETGKWGSKYYTRHPPFPLGKTTANVNIDMVGRSDPGYNGDSTNYVSVIGEDKLSSDLTTVISSVSKKFGKLELDRKFNEPEDLNAFFYRSDHYSFALKGVPIIFFLDGTHKDYHQPTDTPDRINYSLLERRSRFIFYVAWELANRDEMLKRDIVLKNIH